MSLYNTDVQGNANISRNVNVGSHAKVNGDVTVGHNLFVKGWIDAPNIKGPLKGLYASEETLKAAYPRPMPGWFALVGDTLPAQVWRVDGGKWMPTGETGGTFNLWLDNLEADVKDLTDDVRDLEELLDNGLLLGESIAFASTGEAASMTFSIMKRDGTTKAHSKPIPIVTAEKAGMMTAADKRELSAATTAISTINEKIATLETTTANLKKALDKEIADREAADTQLSGRITDETTARKEADEALQALIDQLRKEFDALLETTTANLKKALDKEIADREAADTQLSGRITDETTARKEADEALQALIDQLRKEFDALVGENASEAIDNFTEVLEFLDGLKDTDKLSTKLAELSSADKKLGEDVLELQREVWPLELTFETAPTIVKASQTTPINLNWGATRRGKDVTADAEITLDGAAKTGKAATMNVTLAHGETRQFALKAKYEGMEVTEARSVKGTHPTYFGTVGKDWKAEETAIKTLAELIIGSRALTRTGIATADGKIALAYPKDFGALTSVKDGNGYEVLSSYTRSEVRVNNHDYYCYLLTVPVTASGVTQIYK